jgi:mutator protein MutT
VSEIDPGPTCPSQTPTRIGIAVVEHAGCYLVGTRGPDVPLAGQAEFPGGKCLPGEDPAACACRECHEETGLDVQAERLLLRREFDYPHGSVDLHFWHCRPRRDADVLPRHGVFHWIPAGELAALPFPEANAPLVKLLIDSQTRLERMDHESGN